MKANKSPSFKQLKQLKTLRKQLRAQPSAPPREERARLASTGETFASMQSPTLPSSPLQAEDQALFRQAVKGVIPLKATPRHHPRPATSKPYNAEKRQRQQHAMGQSHLTALHATSDFYDPWDSATTPLAEYLNPICGTDVLRHLKKGRWPIQNSIDLHGATVDRARIRLDYFLQHSLAEQFRCIRIVHGKGYGSKQAAPILPTTVRRWLSQLDFVLAFTNCEPHEGGSGAVKVLLRHSARH